MTDREPVAELDSRFSNEGATPRRWAEAREHLRAAEVFWLSTVRPDGRPHVTPLLAVLLDDALYFCTGPTERKARNLEHNRNCSLVTGNNAFASGLDLVVDGEAVRVTDDARLRALAETYESKYGSEWHFDVLDGAFHSGGTEAHVYEVVPVTAFGFGKGEFSQTRWTF